MWSTYVFAFFSSTLYFPFQKHSFQKNFGRHARLVFSFGVCVCQPAGVFVCVFSVVLDGSFAVLVRARRAMKLSPGRLQVALAERDAAHAERDAANVALAVQVSKDKELEQRLELLESRQQSSILKADSSSARDDDESRETGDPTDAAWLCAASCVQFAESIALAIRACGTFSGACVLIFRAFCAVGATVRRGTSATLNLMSAILTTCRLPPPPIDLPPPEDDEPDDPMDVERGPSQRTQILLASLAAGAVVMFMWNLVCCGLAMAAWVPIGALAGLVGSSVGIGIAVLATPRSADYAGKASPRPLGGEGDDAGIDGVAYQELASGKMWSDLSSAAWSVGAAAAFSGASSGLVAWSTNEVVHEHNEWISDTGRSRMLVLINSILLVGFAARNGYKAWRGGGCTASGRFALVARDGGCGCGWPALL